jgi:hypothetical protein
MRVLVTEHAYLAIASLRVFCGQDDVANSDSACIHPLSHVTVTVLAHHPLSHAAATVLADAPLSHVTATVIA